MSVIAVANQKGGVGKTTSTLNLGAALHEAGKRVLLIDLDPQGNLSVAAGIHDIDAAYPSIGDLLAQASKGEPASLADAIVRSPAGLDIVPGNATLSTAELRLVKANYRESMLATLLESVAPTYDYILIDCLPSLGLLAINALRAADGVVIPVQADFLAVQGLGQIIETIAAVREQLNPNLSILGVVLTLVDQRTMHARDVSRMVRSSLADQVRVFETEVRLHVALKEAASRGRTILEHAPHSPAADAYRALAREVRAALGDEPQPTDVEHKLEFHAVHGFAGFVSAANGWLGHGAGKHDRSQLIAQARSAAYEARFADAALLTEQLLEDLPNCLFALRVLAWSQLELGDDRAPRTFEQCAELDPEDALTYVGQAMWSEQTQDVETAIEQWVQAWELDPHNQTLRRALVKLTGELPESDFADGVALLRAGCYDDATEVLRRCAAERRDAVSALAEIEALWGLGRKRQAFDLATNVLSTFPLSIKASLYVAAFEDGSGHTLRAREVISRIEHVDPGFLIFADAMRQVGLLPAADQHRASRLSLAAAR